MHDTSYAERIQPYKEKTQLSVSGVSPAGGIAASECGCGCSAGQQIPVYAIGQLGHTFTSAARQDSVQQMMEPVHTIPNRPQATDAYDLLRHLLGYSEIEIEEMATGRIASVAQHTDPNGNDVTKITIDGGGPIEDDDTGRVVAISGLCVTFDEGATPHISDLNTSTGLITRAHRIDDTSFYLENVPWSGDDYVVENARWYIPRKCTTRVLHPSHVHDAKAVVWALMRGASVLYAIDPTGPFAEEAYGELVEFMLNHIGVTRRGLNFYYYEECHEPRTWFASWDPCFNDPERNDYTNRIAQPAPLVTARSQRIAVPGTLTGNVQLRTGEQVGTINPELRGTAEWSTEALIERIKSELIPTLPPMKSAEQDLLISKSRELVNRLDEEVRNSGVSSPERALNYAATQHLALIQQIATELAGKLELDTVLPPKPSQHCREGSDCWDVEVSFFDPENMHAAPAIVRQSIDVSDVVPVHFDEIRRFRRRM